MPSSSDWKEIHKEWARMEAAKPVSERVAKVLRAHGIDPTTFPGLELLVALTDLCETVRDEE